MSLTCTPMDWTGSPICVIAGEAVKETLGWESGDIGSVSDPDVQRLAMKLRAQEERSAQLERLLGKKEAELDFLKKLDALERDSNSGDCSVMSGRGRLARKKNAR